jgi:hypothetical protein
MRPSAATLANAAASVVLFGLLCVAFVAVIILGPFGLILLGLLTLFVCTSVSLREDSPSWNIEVFRAQLRDHGSPEQRAARAAEKTQFLTSLVFYRWCGVVLLVAGIAGFTWQRLQ